MDSGKVFVWDTRQPEGWSAFTADFRELEENIEYEEKEDEFDLRDDDDDALKLDEDADEERIDITGIDDAPSICIHFHHACYVRRSPESALILLRQLYIHQATIRHRR